MPACIRETPFFEIISYSASTARWKRALPGTLQQPSQSMDKSIAAHDKLGLEESEMDKSSTIDINQEEAEKVEVAIAECLEAMQRANERMASDQAEIERLKAETRAILAKLEAA